MPQILSTVGSVASWPAATALIILLGVCLLNNGLTARPWTGFLPPPPPPENTKGRVLSSIFGFLFSLFGVLTILFGVLLPQGVTATFALDEGERIEIPAEAIRLSDTNQVIVQPDQLGDLANQWDGLTDEQRRDGLMQLLETPLEGTYVWFEPAGSGDFQLVPWQDVTPADRAMIVERLQSPSIGLDLMIH